MCLEDRVKRLEEIAAGKGSEEIPASKILEIKNAVSGLKPITQIFRDEFERFDTSEDKWFRIEGDDDSTGKGWIKVILRWQRVTDDPKHTFSLGICKLEKGYKIGYHSHKQVESLVMVEGCLHITEEGNEDHPTDLCYGQGFEFAIGQRHKAVATTDCFLVLFSFPASTEWPDPDGGEEIHFKRDRS